MKCKKCDQDNCIKKGKRNNKQRYFCKGCRINFQEGYVYQALKPNTDTAIILLLKEGCGVRSISRILKISTATVLSRILKIGNQVRAPYFDQLACKFEVDELWSFIGTKKNVVWIIYGIERKTGQVIDFLVGRKTTANIKPLINKLVTLLPKQIYTDKLNIYRSLVPDHMHSVLPYCTNHIERKNLTLRTHVKRLARKTICFSKKQEYLEAHLRIYFWG